MKLANKNNPKKKKIKAFSQSLPQKQLHYRPLCLCAPSELQLGKKLNFFLTPLLVLPRRSSSLSLSISSASLRTVRAGISLGNRGQALMTSPLEHDYIGLSELSSMESSDKLSPSSSSLSAEDDPKLGVRPPALNLKETELRLGLPGSQSPKREDGPGLTLGLSKSLVSGAKRGFSDAIDGSSGNWRVTGGRGSEVELGKGGDLFSPRGDNGGGKHSGPAGSVKDVDGAAAAGQEKKAQASGAGVAPAAKAQVVGWPPIRSYRKNTMASNPSKNKEDAEGKPGTGCLYVKVSMDGAPYLRKVDLNTYSNYKEFSSALEKMFSCFTIGQCGSHGMACRDGLGESRAMDLLQGSEYVLTYEDKDGDWMLVGDVPWNMFADTCRRLRIMKGSEAIGIAPRAMEKRKSRS